MPRSNAEALIDCGSKARRLSAVAKLYRRSLRMELCLNSESQRWPNRCG